MGDEVESTTGGVFEDPLATRINAKFRELEGLARSTVEAGIELGGMLLEKKEGMRQGEWGPWVRAYFQGSERQAQRFMQLYRERDKLLENPTRVADLSLRQALSIISPPPKEDQREDTTQKKLVQKLRSVGFNAKFAEGIAGALAANDAAAEPREPETVETLPEALQREVLSAERQTVVDAVAQANEVSSQDARRHYQRDVAEVRNAVDQEDERREQQGKSFHAEERAEYARRLAEMKRRSREADQRYRRQRQESHSAMFMEVDGHFSQVVLELRHAVRDILDAQFDEEEVELLQGRREAVQEMVRLVNAALTGDSGTDWDAELEKLE